MAGVSIRETCAVLVYAGLTSSGAVSPESVGCT